MNFYSHSTTDPNGVTKGSKTLQTHIQGVFCKLLIAHSEKISFGFGQELLHDAFKILVKYHDFGKFTSYFQDYLLKKPSIDQHLKQHARIGGIAAYNALKAKNEKLALTCLYIIFRHHTQLNNTTDFIHVFDENLKRVFLNQKSNLKNRISQIESILQQSDLEKLLEYPDERTIRRGFKRWQLKDSHIKDYFMMNYLFSLLIESDKLDASDTQPCIPGNLKNDSVDLRFGKPVIQDGLREGLTNNELRNFCRAVVVANISRPDILDYKIFTLTAPTGIGKTMTALDFSLKLKSKIREVHEIEPRIIYALPFINIIEQALKEYSDTLPQDVNVLGHYQFADVFGDEKDNRTDSVKNYSQKLMAMDTWQADIVITSFVQFFETLIGNRNKLLKKFNHFANSIIILDEVQTVRLEQMPLIGAVLYYLSEYLNARILLMTATKPKIFDLAQKEILDREGVKVQPFELLLSHKEVFSQFRRTRVYPLLDNDVDSESQVDSFINDIFAEKWSPEKSCLIVCNTVNRSIELYQAIYDYLAYLGLDNPIAYLSTNIIPVHRFERIRQVKEWLTKGKAPILISTQVVEAGVDLDFDMGFRDLGPIDSIIQVAGRINRNNNPQKKYAPLYIVDFGDARKIYGAITAAQSLRALKTKPDFPEEDYLELVDSYFDDIAEKNSFSRYNKIFDSMKMLRYDSENPEEDMPVSKFKIIEESRLSKSVFIEYDEKASLLRQKYLDKITGRISKEEFDKNYKLEFQQHIIAIPQYLTAALAPINEYESNLLSLNNELISQNYNPSTGFIRQQTDHIVML
jgi:CRISPR-associated endonuclease/helicase Cas3